MRFARAVSGFIGLEVRRLMKLGASWRRRRPEAQQQALQKQHEALRALLRLKGRIFLRMLEDARARSR